MSSESNQLYTNNLFSVHSKLGSKVSVELAASASDALMGKESKFSGKALLPCQEMTVYAMNVADDKLPKNITLTSGSFLTGTFSALKDSDLSAVDKSEVIYYLSEYSTRAAKGLSMVTTKKDKNQKEEMTGELLLKNDANIIVILQKPFVIWKFHGFQN